MGGCYRVVELHLGTWDYWVNQAKFHSVFIAVVIVMVCLHLSELFSVNLDFQVDCM